MTPKLDRRTCRRCASVGICHAAILNSDFFLMIRFYFFGAFSRAFIIALSQGSWRPNEETTNDSVERIMRLPTSQFSTAESTQCSKPCRSGCKACEHRLHASNSEWEVQSLIAVLDGGTAHQLRVHVRVQTSVRANFGKLR